jgi:hypothetical protein
MSLLSLCAFTAPHVGSFPSGWPPPPPGLNRLAAGGARLAVQADRPPPPLGRLAAAAGG